MATRALSLRRTRPPVEARRRVSLEQIFERLQAHGREFDPDFLRRVYDFSAAKHQDQKRRSGEPYFSHPLHVAYLLADLKFDQTCVAVGLLHDVLEDTLTERSVVAEEFGEEIAGLVDGVTKIGQHAYVRRDQAQAETFRKLILASARDIRVIVVKLADRLHNMMTLEHMPEESRRRIARETLEIHAPIAHRLGMSRLQGDLEDLAFFYLHPAEYKALAEGIEERRKVGAEITKDILDALVECLEGTGIEADINYRIKRPYSVWRKLQRQGVGPERVYDYLAFRIVTGSQSDCYAALGLVHNNPRWRIVPGRFKDYISNPKPNGYRSLHTTVFTGQGPAFEVQIRTREMDREAEDGIAAHWRYKEGKPDKREEEGDIRWLRQLVDLQQDVKDPRSFLSALRIDLYPDEVYAFTPKGDVLAFPRGATPLDFAYRVHTEVGHRCAGARVNGKLVALKTALTNGDIVEIITNPARHPSRDWLALVVTPRAKSKIRAWLATQQKEQAMEIGRRLLERELAKVHLHPKAVAPQLAAHAEAEGLGRTEELYTRIGFGKISARSVLDRILTEEQQQVRGEAKQGEAKQGLGAMVRRILPTGGGPSPVEVRGQDDLMAFLAKCCNPLPGEDIVGYITRGRGVSVHSAECPNVRDLLYNPEREIEVRWAHERGDVYPVSLLIETEDRPGMLARLTEVIAKHEGNIRQIEAATETGRGLIEIVLEVRDRRQLERLRQRLGAVSGVLGVDRLMRAERRAGGQPAGGGASASRERGRTER